MRPAGQVRVQVLTEDLDDSVVLLRDRAGGVRAHEHVRQVPERARLRRRLGREHVERGPAQPTLDERVGERRLIDDVPAGDVHDDRPLGQEPDPAGVEEAVGLGRVRRRQDDRVQARQDGVEVADRGDLVGMDVGRGAVGDRADDPDHVGVEGAQEPRRLAADPPRPDDGHHLAGHLLAGVAAPHVGALVCLVAQYVLAEHQHREHRELGQRPGVDAARGRHHDVAPLGQPDAPRELADPGARRLDPAQARPLREPVGEGERAEVEQDLRALEQLDPALLGPRVGDLGQRVRRGVLGQRG